MSIFRKEEEEWTNSSFFIKIILVKKMIRTVFMGTPLFAVPILDTLLEYTDVILVVTTPDKCVGRKKELTLSSVKQEALKRGIPVFQPNKIREDYEEISKLKPDLIITCAYGQILPKELLDLPPLGCINIHASLLPLYRGGAPIQYALINGDEKTGITIMYMDEKMDTGDIIAQESIPILASDNLGSLSAKLSKLGSSLLAKTLPSIINKTNKREKQQEQKATYAYTIKREDEHLDFHKTSEEINNLVRALNPKPYANILLDDEETKIIEGYVGNETKMNAATICEIKKDAIGIACQDKVFYVTKLKPFGKKEMSAKDYLNGVNKEELMLKVVK